MKKFIITGLCIVSLLTITFTSCSTEENVDTRSGFHQKDDGDPIIKGGSVSVKLGFGRTSKKCAGIGICRIESVGGHVDVGGVKVDIDKAVRQVSTMVSGQPYKSGNVKTIRFEFIGSGTYAWAKEFFEGDIVILEEDTTFDMTEINSYGFDFVEDFTVPAGSYPMTYNDQTKTYGFTFVTSSK